MDNIKDKIGNYLNEAKSSSVSIDKFIKMLQDEKKKGGKTVEVSGTVLVPENGNSIVISTGRQK